MTAATAGLVFAALFAAHGLADHWFQTDHQANHKGDHSARGQFTCARHAAVHVLTSLVFLAALLPLDVTPTWTGVAAGQAWIFVSHYAIDRRWTVLRVATWLGQRGFHDFGAPRLGYTVLAEHQVLHRRADGSTIVRIEQVPVALDQPVLGTGRYALDQTAHIAALFVAALLTALV